MVLILLPYFYCLTGIFPFQNLAIELSSANIQSATSTGLMSTSSASVPLLARVYLRLGTWQWALSPALDEDSIQGN